LSASSCCFTNLSHAFTIAAESGKKTSATSRGRFNMGEKLALAMCDSAEILTTTGCVTFDADGRHISRKRLQAGSRVTLRLRMTEEERERCDAFVRTLLAPGHCTTRYNGEMLRPRTPLATTEHSLQTELADAEGMLRRTSRVTRIAVHDPEPGEDTDDL